MAEPVRIIDISHWQGFPDFAKVHAQGVIACIMKATEGVSYKDPNCARNTINAEKNGIKCCTYHWLKPRKFASATAQMKFYLETIDPVPGERVIIDYEENGCTLQDLIEAVTFLHLDQRKLQITVYSGHLLKEQLDGKTNPFLALNTDLWLAQYTTERPSWPDKTYPRWRLWQYSESGRFDGIIGSAVDLNRFAGTDEELLAWISPQPLPVAVAETAQASSAVGAALSTVPVLTSGTSPTLSIVDITVPAGVSIRVNGKLV